MFIDTHIHWNNDTLYPIVDTLIEAAFAVDVRQFLVIGFDHDTNRLALELAERYPFVKASVGFHPTIAHTLKETDYEQLEALARHANVHAIGEFGIDLYWEKDTLNQQIESLDKQVALAKKLNKPIIIHMRDATEATYKALKKHAPLRGVMHCYSGSAEMMASFLALGLHIGIGGPVTFKNAQTPKEVARLVPLDRLLLETDAPYLAPHPHRGKTNGAHYIPLIAQAIADCKQLSIETIKNHTTTNARNLFSLGDV